MRVLARLLNKMILMRFVLILFGLVTFVLSLDITANAESILALNPSIFKAIGVYVLMRMPGIASQFIIISILLATLLTLSDASRHSELVAIWNAGVSQSRIILLLLPATIFFAIGHFLLIDQAAPRVAPILHKWAIGDYSNKKLAIGENDPLWMRSGQDILRAGKGNIKTTHLEDVIIFKRDKNSVLVEQILASEANLIKGRWVLKNAIIYYTNDQPPSYVDKLIYSGPMRPAATGTRTGDPAEMSLATLAYFISNAGFGIRPKHVYSTWLHKRIAVFFSAILMMLIAIPLAHRYRRGGGLGLLFMLGVSAGFAFFIFDGISLTMGELGILAPWLAAWAPVIIFSAGAGMMIFRQETL